MLGKLSYVTYLERNNWYESCVGVELLLRVLLVIPLPYDTQPHQRMHSLYKQGPRTLKLDTDPTRWRLDATFPELLVQTGVDADVCRAHRFLGECDDGLDGMGRPLLEGAAVYPLVEVDGVFTGDNILESRASLAGL